MLNLYLVSGKGVISKGKRLYNPDGSNARFTLTGSYKIFKILFE
jgi:hypothetical protein